MGWVEARLGELVALVPHIVAKLAPWCPDLVLQLVSDTQVRRATAASIIIQGLYVSDCSVGIVLLYPSIKVLLRPNGGAVLCKHAG